MLLHVERANKKKLNENKHQIKIIIDIDINTSDINHSYYSIIIKRSNRGDLSNNDEFNIPIIVPVNFIKKHWQKPTSQKISEAVVRRCSMEKAAPATLLKKRLWHRCFPVNFAKFLRTPFFTEHLWWLLLRFVQYFLESFYLI